MKTLVKCPHCLGDNEVPEDGLYSCCECGKVFNVSDESPVVTRARPIPLERMATIERDWGRQILVCLLVLIGIGSLVLSAVAGVGGFLFAILLWVIAAILDRRSFTCSECASPASTKAKLCAACGCRFRN
jgi:hypothetical protein